MARPPAANAEATRDRILSSASSLFAQSGPAVSVRQVAKRAGVTLATVHHYFGPKAALYQACIERMYQELASLQDALVAEIDPGQGLAQQTERAVRTSFRFAWAHRGAIRLLMRMVVDTGRQPDERLAAVHLPFLEQSAALLEPLYGASARLLVQSVLHLCVRYALTDPQELQLVTNAASEAQALDRVEAHLVELTQAMSLKGDLSHGPQ